MGNLAFADPEHAFGLQIDSTRVLAMQFVELWADFPPNARLFRRVIDDRRSQVFEPAFAANGEELFAPLDVLRVAKTRMTLLQFLFRGVRRLHHELWVDRGAILNKLTGLFHRQHPENPRREARACRARSRLLGE